MGLGILKMILLLDNTYEPLGIVHWQRAITLIFSGKAEVIEETDKLLRSQSMTIKLPAVVRLLHKARLKRKFSAKFTRNNLFARDQNTCFKEGTRILLSDGRQIPIEKVEIGDHVIDAFGESTVVVNKGYKESDTVEVKYRGSNERIYVTEDHPFLNEDREFVPLTNKPEYFVFPRKIEYKLTNPQNIDVLSYLQSDKWFKIYNGRIYCLRRNEPGLPAIIESNENLAYILGLYVGDGSATKSGGTITWSFNVNQKFTYVEDVKSWIKSIGLNPFESQTKESKGYVIGTHNKILALILRKLCGGGKWEHKKIPFNIIGKYHRSFLKGLFSADGYIHRNNQKITLSMVSPDVIFGAQSMLWGLGIYPTIEFLKGRSTDKITRKDSWSLHLQGKNYSSFMETVLGEEVKDGEVIFGNDSFIFRKVQSIYPDQQSPRIVYNIETESHSYIANGLSVHNCQYCREQFSEDELTFDHVVPITQGGKKTWENIVAACEPCNSRKEARTPDQAGMSLMKKPKPPAWPQVVTIMVSVKKLPEVWKNYLYQVA